MTRKKEKKQITDIKNERSKITRDSMVIEKRGIIMSINLTTWVK